MPVAIHIRVSPYASSLPSKGLPWPNGLQWRMKVLSPLSQLPLLPHWFVKSSWDIFILRECLWITATLESSFIQQTFVEQHLWYEDYAGLSECSLSSRNVELNMEEAETYIIGEIKYRRWQDEFQHMPQRTAIKAFSILPSWKRETALV